MIHLLLYLFVHIIFPKKKLFFWFSTQSFIHHGIKENPIWNQRVISYIKAYVQKCNPNLLVIKCKHSSENFDRFCFTNSICFWWNVSFHIYIHIRKRADVCMIQYVCLWLRSACTLWFSKSNFPLNTNHSTTQTSPSWFLYFRLDHSGKIGFGGLVGLK